MIKYGDGTNSTVGTQFNTYEYKRKALIETAQVEYFGQLGDVETLTKNYGQKIKKYHYLPLLDDRNINDQGLDATGATIVTTGWSVTYPGLVFNVANADKTTTAATINANVGNKLVATAGADGSGGTGLATITLSINTATYDSDAKKDAVVALNLGVVVQQGSGNLYGSSKDPGVISGKLPALSEAGGRVNRVGFKRLEIEGDIAQYGFFYEWSEEALNFDTDADLYSHINRESVRGAREVSEDILQMDLLDAAGVVKFMGTSAVSLATVNTVIAYNDLVKLGVTLDDNRCPKDTKAIKGSQDTDVVNIGSARYAFIGSELIPTLMRLTDYHGDRAFVPVEKYAKIENGKYMNTLHGEIGSVAGFRFVVVPEMMQYKGQGVAIASAVDGSTLQSDGTNIDVYPILVVGSGSFAKINFQSSGTTNDKFKIIVRKPGTFANPEDPFEKIGYSSIQFWQGTMILRPEWIAKVLTGAKA